MTSTKLSSSNFSEVRSGKSDELAPQLLYGHCKRVCLLQIDCTRSAMPSTGGPLCAGCVPLLLFVNMLQHGPKNLVCDYVYVTVFKAVFSCRLYWCGG